MRFSKNNSLGTNFTENIQKEVSASFYEKRILVPLFGTNILTKQVCQFLLIPLI